MTLATGGNPYHRGHGPGGGQFTSRGEAGLGGEELDYKKFTGARDAVMTKARKSFGVPSPTPAQRQAIREYTSAYNQVNESLRAGRVLSSSDKAMLKHVDNYMIGAHAKQNVRVYRIASGTFREEQLDKLKRGAILKDRAFMSTSLVQPPGRITPMSMTILVPKGSRAAFLAPYSADPHETEVLLPRNSKLLYLGRGRDGYYFRLMHRTVAADKAVEGVSMPKEFDPEELAPKGALQGMAKGSHPSTISPRLVSAKAVAADTANKYLPMNLDAMAGDEEQLAHNASLLTNPKFYPNLRAAEAKRKPMAIMQAMREHAKSNLIALYNAATEEERGAVNWYRSAHTIAVDLARRYKLNDAAVVGVIAAMSPQKDWDTNLYLATAMLDIYATKQGHRWDKKMEATAGEIWKPKDRELVDKIRGKSLGDLKDPYEKAAWIRTYDEAHNDRHYHAFSNDTTTLTYYEESPLVQSNVPRVRVDEEGNKIRDPYARAAWNTNDNVANAVMALESGGDRRILSDAMGKGAKVRSFYNNILDPDSGNNDLTVDTHAIGAALMRPLGGQSVPVWHSMGLAPEVWQKPKGFKGTSKSAFTGVTGLYALYADAYRDAAKALKIRPNELQAVVWVVKRNILLARMYKGKKVDKLNALWRDYHDKSATLEETQAAIIAYGRELQKQSRGEEGDEE